MRETAQLIGLKLLPRSSEADASVGRTWVCGPRCPQSAPPAVSSNQLPVALKAPHRC